MTLPQIIDRLCLVEQSLYSRMLEDMIEDLKLVELWLNASQQLRTAQNQLSKEAKPALTERAPDESPEPKIDIVEFLTDGSTSYEWKKATQAKTGITSAYFNHRKAKAESEKRVITDGRQYYKEVRFE